MRRLLPFAVLLLASTASAQVETARYRPLAVGDTWTYRYDYGSGSTSTCDPETPRAYNRLAVVGDTLLEGEPQRVLACQNVSLAGVPVGQNRYAVRMESDGGLTATLLANGGGCGPVAAGAIYAMTVNEPGSVTIGGIPYAVPGTRSWDLGGVGGPGGAGWAAQGLFAADIGPVRYTYRSYRVLPPSYCGSSTWWLEHAVVGGVEYGVNPVASEPIPAPVSGLAVTAFPSPTRGAATLRLALPSAQAVRAEVFSVLGRRVYAADLGARPAGGSEVVLDASGWAPGVYVVRVADGSGAVATTRLVRAD